MDTITDKHLLGNFRYKKILDNQFKKPDFMCRSTNNPWHIIKVIYTRLRTLKTVICSAAGSNVNKGVLIYLTRDCEVRLVEGEIPWRLIVWDCLPQCNCSVIHQAACSQRAWACDSISYGASGRRLKSLISRAFFETPLNLENREHQRLRAEARAHTRSHTDTHTHGRTHFCQSHKTYTKNGHRHRYRPCHPGNICTTDFEFKIYLCLWCFLVWYVYNAIQ